jgi:hypothetical protein
MKIFAFFALCAILTACYNRATTTSHTEKRATERHETATETETSYESKAAIELYTHFSEYDSLFAEQAPTGELRVRIYGGKQNTTLDVSKNETSRHEQEKEMELTINDSTLTYKMEDIQTAINAHTPKQIESKTWIGVLFVLFVLAILISIDIIKRKRPVQMRDYPSSKTYGSPI